MSQVNNLTISIQRFLKIIFTDRYLYKHLEIHNISIGFSLVLLTLNVPLYIDKCTRRFGTPVVHSLLNTPWLASSLNTVVTSPFTRSLYDHLSMLTSYYHGPPQEGDSAPVEIWSKNQKYIKKNEDNSLVSNWFNSCNDSLFAGMTLSLHKSQVHCPDVMQWWACSSLMSFPLPRLQKQVAKLASGLFYR